MKFSQLGLSESLLRAVKTSGYETTTAIQGEAIPSILTGKDLLGCAQTGTGKTAAFTLPMLNRLLETRTKSSKLRALVLVPTRELAAQVAESVQRYGQFTQLRQTAIYGGVSQNPQVKQLNRGVDVLVATPGRLLDLMNQGYIDLSTIEILVLDEADQMLDLGFLPDLKRIVRAVPEQRQTLMFSATMPVEVRKLAQQWLTQPVEIQSAAVGKPVERIAQSVHFVDQRQKATLLALVLQQMPQSRTLVFVRTKHGVDKIVKRLESAGLSAAGIHGNKTQNARTRALARFKSNNPPILVATDIAARGLNVEEVSHVINFDLPDTAETYIHRIGRTARAGADGVAISFCGAEERRLLTQIERHTNLSLPKAPLMEGFAPSELMEISQSDAFPQRTRRKTSKYATRSKSRTSNQSQDTRKPSSNRPKRPANRPPRKNQGRRPVSSAQ